MKDLLTLLIHIIKTHKDIFYKILIRTIIYTLTLFAAMHLFTTSDKADEDTTETTYESDYTDE